MTKAKTSTRRKAEAGDTSWCKAYGAHSAVDGASKPSQPARTAQRAGSEIRPPLAK